MKIKKKKSGESWVGDWGGQVRVDVNEEFKFL